MYRTNFYGQTLANLSFMRAYSSETLPLLPLRSLQETTTSNGDAFLAPQKTSFEIRLATELNALKQSEEALKKELAAFNAKPSDPAIKNNILIRYNLIDHMRKLLNFLADSMQKTMQNIAANFR